MIRCRPTTVAIVVLVASACGGRTISDGGDGAGSETGSAESGDPAEPLFCEGPNAPTSPIALVEGDMVPAQFLRVGDRLYWADGWDEWEEDSPSITLYRTNIAGDEPRIPVAEDQPGIHRILSDGEFIYWIVEGIEQPAGALLRASLDDEVEILDSGLNESARALALDVPEGWIYYSEGSEASEYEDASLLRIRPDGSDKQVFLDDDLQRIEDIEIDETHVWWASDDYERYIGRMAKDGSGEPEFIFGESGSPHRIEVKDGIAWTIGFIGFYRQKFGEEPYFINGHSGPWEIAVDSTHFYFPYWNSFEDTHLGWVHRYPLIPDGEYDPLAGEFVIDKVSPKPTSVLVDENAVYWSTADLESGQGGIWMICKSAL